MKFKANSRQKAIEYEKGLVQYWKKHKTFEKSIEQRPVDNSYVFYDGPPFITGVPHHGTLLSSIVKDAVPRYQTMKGKRVERVWGWDCHGLPAENFVEKKLGITSRQEIGTKISLEDYIIACRENMVATGDLWEDTIDRIGRWVDFKGAYKTMDKDYMESVWWAFKQLYEKGKIYEGEKVLMYDTQWATPLSKAEVTMDTGAYIEVTDPSVYVKFKLKNFHLPKPNEIPASLYNSKNLVERSRAIESDEYAKKIVSENHKAPIYLLAWTTTPWTLPANTAVAVNEHETYVLVYVKGEFFVIGETLYKEVLRKNKEEIPHTIIRSNIFGSEFVGLDYEPFLGVDRGKNAHKVWHADYVTHEKGNGTGIVHLAPIYGEEDYALAQEHNFPAVHVLDEYGKYTEGDWEGENVWEINKTIARALYERGVVWKIDYILHEYPHNPRTGQRLMYRAHPSWFMDIDGQRIEMLEQNTEHIDWFPEHIKHGRFENTIKTAPDWNLSRDRFWATAMPVWKGIDKNGKEHVKVVGSYEELKDLSGIELEDYHRPWIDDITFEIDGIKYKRIDKVLDCWFESGSMPFAQFHYPFENVEKFEQNFPGDFIIEYVGQVRAWFYYMHAVNVGLFGRNAFRNVITTGTLAGNDGRKMSKSYGNFTDPNELMDQYSADALRFLLLGSPVLNGEDYALHDKDVSDVARKLSMVWNMYDFFTLYASVDKWEWNGKLEDPSKTSENILDQWIVSRVHQLVEKVEEHMENYDIPNAVKPILPFIDDASNWYVRRSRKRFWKTDNDTDKDNAYHTLHYILVMLAQVMAPFTPFLAEELYQKLTSGESVHLLDWPEAGNVNEIVVESMTNVRQAINDGLSKRAQAGKKVRQPLASATLISTISRTAPDELNQELVGIVKEELNVKKVKPVTGSEINGSVNPGVELDLELTPDLKREGLMREVVRVVQNARKKAGLNVDDRIKLSLKTNGELDEAIKEHEQVILQETLAKTLTNQDYSYNETMKIENFELNLSLEKVKE